MNGKILSQYITEEYRDTEAEQYMGIFGNPVRHTLSPLIHDTLNDFHGIAARYVPFEVPEHKLSECVREAYDTGILGLNITVPYKQAVMSCLSRVDADAQAIGAVNTLVREEDGFAGYNTDMPGLARALMHENIFLEKSKVIIIGAGGAARAVAYMCLKYGAERVYILNRTYEKAKGLADDMNRLFFCSVVQPVAAEDYRSIPRASYIMLQCTSIGLSAGDGLPLVSDEAFYEMASCGVDLIYNPVKTPFLSLLSKLHIPCFNGLRMLLYQGILAYELWTNVKVSVKDADIVYRRLSEQLYGKKIVLIGYMGSGKTTVGKCIADGYGLPFVDTDVRIEAQTGMKISTIFEKYGEEYFRNLETETLREICQGEEGCVISTGGGLPLREENRKMLKSLGNVYFLRANADIIYNRVSDDKTRPLLAGNGLYQKICDMLAVREPVYMAAADVILETDTFSPEEIAAKIMKNH